MEDVQQMRKIHYLDWMSRLKYPYDFGEFLTLSLTENQTHTTFDCCDHDQKNADHS